MEKEDTIRKKSARIVRDEVQEFQTQAADTKPTSSPPRQIISLQAETIAPISSDNSEYKTSKQHAPMAHTFVGLVGFGFPFLLTSTGSSLSPDTLTEEGPNNTPVPHCVTTPRCGHIGTGGSSCRTTTSYPITTTEGIHHDDEGTTNINSYLQHFATAAFVRNIQRLTGRRTPPNGATQRAAHGRLRLRPFQSLPARREATRRLQ